MSAPQQSTDAETLKAEAARWLERQDRDDWSADDRHALDAWLSQSMAHRTAYWRLEAAWSRTERLAALRFTSSPAPVEASKPIKPFLIGIAAALAFVAMLGAGIAMTLWKPSERIYSTTLGGHESIAFADGSKIELNTDTTIRARMTTSERVVWLDKGEAYFEVKHDPAHPFVVIAGDRRVTDLGTQFLVRRDRRDLKVAVIEGRVWFDTRDKRVSAQTSLLTTGDVATVSADKLSVTRSNVPELTDELAWRRGMLVFHRTPLGAAVAQFNRYNRDHLVIADTKTANLQIDGTFPANDPSAFTDIVQDILHLRITRQGNATLISR